jgi:uncharacterized protein YbjT (DUF2867 family)
MYVITGATGNIGSKAVDLLLDRGEKVRVIGRDASRLQRFVDRGAEAATGDLKDWGFLRKAFGGATAVFCMIPPNYKAGDFRAYQNELGTSIANAVKNSGVSHVVNLSSQGAELSEGTGPIKGLHDQEERLNGIQGVHVLHLRPTYFMENLLMNIPLIKQKGIAGSAVRGDIKFAMIATRDIASYVVDRLVKRDFEGKTFRDLLGQRDLSLGEATSIIGRSIGMPDLKYAQFSYDDTAKWMAGMGISEDLCRLIVEMSKAMNDGIICVNRPRTADNTTPTSIEDYAGAFAKAFAAAPVRQAI